jgi:hypothetical protein
LDLILTKDTSKDLKNSVRWGDENGHNIYLKKPEAAALGNPDKIKIVITAEK